MKVSNELVNLQLALLKSIQASEYGDIRSIMDEQLPAPLWSEQVIMTQYLNKHVNGALFSYDKDDGWYYVEEGS